MKIKKSVFAAILALVLAVGLVGGAGAAAVRQQITATLRPDITIKLDGEVTIPKDANGNRVYPIMYSGTTYVPIRAVSGMLGIGVDWDQATQTVLLGASPDGTDLIDTLKAYYLSEQYAIVAEQNQTADKKGPISISGISCSHWVELYLSQYADKNALCSASFNVGGKYTTVTFQYYSNQDITLRVLGDNESVLKTIGVKGGQLAQTVTVDLLGSSQLTFQAEKLVEKDNTKDKATNAYIFNATLK